MKNYRKEQFKLAVLLEVKEESRRNGDIVLAAEERIKQDKKYLAMMKNGKQTKGRKELQFIIFGLKKDGVLGIEGRGVFKEINETWNTRMFLMQGLNDAMDKGELTNDLIVLNDESIEFMRRTIAESEGWVPRPASVKPVEIEADDAVVSESTVTADEEASTDFTGLYERLFGSGSETEEKAADTDGTEGDDTVVAENFENGGLGEEKTGASGELVIKTGDTEENDGGSSWDELVKAIETADGVEDGEVHKEVENFENVSVVEDKNEASGELVEKMSEHEEINGENSEVSEKNEADVTDGVGSEVSIDSEESLEVDANEGGKNEASGELVGKETDTVTDEVESSVEPDNVYNEEKLKGGKKSKGKNKAGGRQVINKEETPAESLDTKKSKKNNQKGKANADDKN